MSSQCFTMPFSTGYLHSKECRIAAASSPHITSYSTTIFLLCDKYASQRKLTNLDDNSLCDCLLSTDNRPPNHGGEDVPGKVLSRKATFHKLHIATNIRTPICHTKAPHPCPVVADQNVRLRHGRCYFLRSEVWLLERCAYRKAGMYHCLLS